MSQKNVKLVCTQKNVLNGWSCSMFLSTICGHVEAKKEREREREREREKERETEREREREREKERKKERKKERYSSTKMAGQLDID